MATQSICKIDGCDKPHHSKGWCNSHYNRWRKHGDPFGGNTGWGEAQRFYNEVVLAYEGDECLIWPYARASKGYASLGNKVVSRLVCEEAHGAPPAPEYDAAHSCGKGKQGCVTKGHMSWKTKVENCADKLLHDTHNRGERHGIAKLTKGQAIEIQALKGKARQSELAERFGVSRSTISLIQSGKNWAWLTAKSEPA